MVMMMMMMFTKVLFLDFDVLVVLDVLVVTT